MLAEAANANRSEIVAALKRASAATGSDFNYLLTTAMRESSLKPQAQSTTSSAAGLFQFIEQTWMGLVKEHGAQFGLKDYADSIRRGADGRYRAANNGDRQAILALRKDPQASAYMAGVFAQQQRSQLQSELGRDVCGGELYAAHFLGTDAACKLIQLAASNPNASAAKSFPNAAAANRTVFYHRDGTAKSVREVYDWALKKHGGAPVTMEAPAKAAPAEVDATFGPAFEVKPAFDAGSDARLANAEYEMLAPDWMLTPERSLLGGGLPRSQVMMSPAILDLLSSFSPVAQSRPAS